MEQELLLALRHLLGRDLEHFDDTYVQRSFVRESRDIPHLAVNPVPRPEGLQIGEYFPIDSTVQGLRLLEKLGPGGFASELRTWSPVVSAQFDICTGLLTIVCSPHTPELVREVFGPYLLALYKTLTLSVESLEVLRLKAESGDSHPGAWRLLQERIRLTHSARQFSGQQTVDTLKSLSEDYLKSLSKSLGQQKAAGTRTLGTRKTSTAPPPKDKTKHTKTD